MHLSKIGKDKDLGNLQKNIETNGPKKLNKVVFGCTSILGHNMIFTHFDLFCYQEYSISVLFLLAFTEHMIKCEGTCPFNNKKGKRNY